MPQPTPTPAAPTPSELEHLYETTSNWGRWGADDERGALNFLSAAQRAAALALAREGLVLSLARDLPLAPSPEQPEAAQHHMLAAGDARASDGIPGYEASRDWFATPVHGLGVTHVDALCHMFVRGSMWNGYSAAEVRSDGARRNTLAALAEGLVGRGVLLDVPATRGVAYLEPSDAIGTADLEAAERAQDVRVGTGDVLIVATGRDARRAATGEALDPFAGGLAGLHPECLRWLHAREIAALGSDGISDAMPGFGVAGWPFPIHQIGITRIGLHLVDNLRLDGVLAACSERRRWEFLFMLAPIRIPRATGCPVNPLAAL